MNEYDYTGGVSNQVWLTLIILAAMAVLLLGMLWFAEHR